ncbi:MAG: redoxin domain-containing protein [Bacteroidales bacterium]
MITKSYLKLTLITILLFAVQISKGQNKAIIEGDFPKGNNKYIAILAYNDLLSQTVKVVASTTVKKGSTFSLEVPLNETIFAQIQFGFQKANIFLEPGKKYQIDIQSNGDYSPKTAYDEDPLVYTFKDHSPENINLILQGFDNIYNSFMVRNFNKIYQKADHNLIDSIYNYSKPFLQSNNKYVQNYAKYKLANLELLGHRKNKNKIFESYFYEKPIRYQNIEYMTFFNDFFEMFLKSGGNNKKTVELRDAINKGTNLSDLLTILTNDVYLRDAELQDLIICKSLSELYYDQLYKQRNIRKLIIELKDKTNFPEIKKITANYLNVFDKLTLGSIAPEFNLPNTDGQRVKLSDYKGYYVLLNFWKDGCMGCELQMKYLNDLLKKYPKNLKVISISAAPHRGYDKSLKLKYNYPWIFLNFENKFDLLMDYNVNLFPTFVLIDKNGKILKSPAPYPDGNLGSLLERVIFSKKKNKK